MATLPTFDGTPGPSAEKWLRDREDAQRKYDWSDPVAVDSATSKLKGRAKFWYHTQRNQRITYVSWAAFRKAFLRHYYPGIADADASLALSQLKYNQDRPVIEFFDKISDAVFALCRKQYDRAERHPKKTRLLKEAVAAHRAQLYTHFLGGLPQTMRTTIMTQANAPQNADDLLLAAQKFEQQQAQLAKHDKQESDVSAVQAQPPSHRGRGRGRGGTPPASGAGRGGYNTPGVTCHYCGKLNHIAAQCFQKQRDFDAFVADQQRQRQQQPAPQAPAQPRPMGPRPPMRGGAPGRFFPNRGRGFGRGGFPHQGRVFETEQFVDDAQYPTSDYPPSTYHGSEAVDPASVDTDHFQHDAQVRRLQPQGN